MSRNWIVVLVVLFLLTAGVAERVSAFYVARLTARREVLESSLEAAAARTLEAVQEKEETDAVELLAEQLQGAILWDPDSTNLLRWFAETAAGVGVRVVKSRMISTERNQPLAADAAFQRMRFDLQLEGGSYGLLVQYVERVEHAPQVILIEKLTLTEDRERLGGGILNMTVSCLYPNPIQPEPEDSKEQRGAVK